MIHALFIDDNRGNLSTFEIICNTSGIQYTGIQFPTTVEEALDQLDVDVVFLDLDMPQLNGYDIFMILRSHPNFREKPIAACTVHNTEMSNAQATGFDSFILKPINIDKFAQQIKAIANGEAIWQRQISHK